MKNILLTLVLLVTFVNVNAQCYNKISAGANHTLAIRSNGTLWAWGYNLDGELGNNSTTNSLVPIQIGTATDWQSISAGGQHSLAIKTNGTLWAWGFNFYGQIGNNTTTNSLIPVQIGTDTNWQTVSAGGYHSLAIKTNGTLWAWGDNYYKQLGIGIAPGQLVPIQVGTDSNWETISAGGNHSLAKKTNSSLWAWGNNAFGQLGNNSTTSNPFVPALVNTLIPWTKISAGAIHNLAIKSDGTLWAWGSNAVGQVGDNTTIIKTSPVQIGTDTNWDVIDAGYNNSIAKKTDYSFYSWGWNDSGQLGDNTLIYKTVPTRLGTATNWGPVSTGGKFVVALTTSGFFINTHTWGNNEFGQLGDGTVVNKLIPTSINSCNILILANDSFNKNNFSIYPNPATSILNIQNDENLQIDKLTIHDISGKLIGTENQNFESINIQNLETGIYFLQIISNQKISQYKFIKQ